MTSDKKNISLLTDIFIKKGLTDIVISPGSRNAPIILSFTNHQQIRALSIVDERSAAFFALGMAQQTGKAVAIACTSGSAALNYAPAIAEAYYQKIPLLILTADRPPELIENGDGQTIRQKNVYANYIKASFELPVEIEDADKLRETELLINRAIDLTTWPEPGPIHINIPFREPLYNTVEKNITGSVTDFKKPTGQMSITQLKELAETWNLSQKVMIIAGQENKNEKLNKLLEKIALLSNTIILTETTSNLYDSRYIDCIDNVVSTIKDQESQLFQPNLLITFGGQVVSKMVKSFLRRYRPQHHWHISNSGQRLDTYFSLNRVISHKAGNFFRQILPLLNNPKSEYATQWLERKKTVLEKKKNYLERSPFTDLKVFEYLLNNIPRETFIHLGNSTPVRYSQLFGSAQNFTYFSNRGVSGIDGQISTAAGAAYVSSKINTIITGDLGFFYDSNALMNHYLSANLRIIVINNGGGGIFRFIEGPASTPQLDVFFEARHNWKSAKIAEAFGITYFKAENMQQLMEHLPEFYSMNLKVPAVLEIFTPTELNAEVLRNYFLYLKS